VLSLLNKAARYLDARSVPNARWHAELLLGSLTGMRRHELYLDAANELSAGCVREYIQNLQRRGAGEPTQYILAHTEFYGLAFRCDERALIPRPETEHSVDAVITRCKAQPDARILDVGTGTGCIAVSLAVHLPLAKFVATDLKGSTLDLASENASNHQVEDRIDFRTSDLYEQVPEEFDVIVSNPPYVEAGSQKLLQREIRDWEPPEALFAGPDGLAILEPLIRQAPSHLVQGGHLIVEIGATQQEAVLALFDRSGAFDAPETVADLQGHPRVMCARKM
jgi:release factor glutamine methyltransferase